MWSYWLCVRRRTVNASQAALLGLRDFLSCLAHLLVRKAGQVVDPAQQRLLFVTARLDPLAAGVFHALRGLPQQQRLLGILPIDQIDQLESERRDLGLAGVGLGKFEPCVSEATPLSLWHRSHCAACSIGCSFSTKNDSSTLPVACADATGVNAAGAAATTKARNITQPNHRLRIDFLPTLLVTNPVVNGKASCCDLS